MRRINLILLISILFSVQACSQKSEKAQLEDKPAAELQLNKNFGDQWYQGQAELNSYELVQVRYGQERKGKAVLIFVTEDFSKSKQVKLDNPSSTPEDVEKVMKLNFTKKFNTGIYPYSMMSSIFSPVYPTSDLHAVKITTSVQEWCGHVFMQWNKRSNKYEALIRSYFESEGDENFEIDVEWTEDEIWNLLRLDPSSIPNGNIKMIPSQMYLRLKHKASKAYKASIEKDIMGDTSQLTIKYPELDRQLKINYGSKFPHTIYSWQESYPENGQQMTSTAELKKSLMLDYWNRNSVADSTYRKALELAE